MQTSDTEAARQMAALQNLIPDLARLEDLQADANATTLQALRNFATKNPDLQRLEGLLAEEKAQPDEFNLFDTLNLWWQEDSHSRVLTWLLGPGNNHGIGDHFLKSFLSASGSLSGVDTTGDWSKAESQREWYCVVDGSGGWLDILVTNDDAQFACAIENKIFSLEGGRQLTHYRKALEAAYPVPDFTKRYVFLSPSGMESQWEDEREFWKPMTYTTILQLVEQSIDYIAVEMSEDVRVFLRQYANTLRRKIVPESNEVAQLARKIYLEHREAIELLYQHKPNYRDECKQILKEAISRHTDWKLDRDDPSFVYFQPLGFTEYQGMQPGESHARYSLVGCEFHCPQEGNARFRVEIAPETESNKLPRDKIVDTINQHPGIFNSAGQVAPGWMVVHRGDYILDNGDLSTWDDPSVRAKIHAWVKNFAENEFPAMNEAIVNCLREY